MFEDIVISDFNSIIVLYFRFNDFALSSRNVARNFTKIKWNVISSSQLRIK